MTVDGIREDDDAIVERALVYARQEHEKVFVYFIVMTFL
jgi:hypothetical protein